MHLWKCIKYLPFLRLMTNILSTFSCQIDFLLWMCFSKHSYSVHLFLTCSLSFSIKIGFCEQSNGMLALYNSLFSLFSLYLIGICFFAARLQNHCDIISPIAFSIDHIESSGRSQNNRLSVFDWGFISTFTSFNSKLLYVDAEH